MPHLTLPKRNSGKTRRLITSERHINSLRGLLAFKMIRQQFSLTNRLTHQSTTLTNERRQWWTRAEHCRLKSGPPLMRGGPQTLKTCISQQPHSNLGWRNAPQPSLTYAAIPWAGGILPRHNKTGRPKPGNRTSDTWLISETKVSEHNSISYWDEATVRSLRFPVRPRTLLQSILQTAGTGRRGPGFVSTSRNRSLGQP